jgi:iron complex outermembrane receptor protein
LNAYEVGMKSQWWNRRAELNVAAFHYDYRNQQFLDAFALPGGAGTGFHTVNAPKSRIDGAEFEARAQVTPDLQLRAGLGLLHTKYVELTLHGVDLAGNRLIQAPDYDASGAIEWRFARLVAGDLRLLLDGNLYGKQYFDAPNTERISQGFYAVANGRITFTGKSGFGAAAWIKNLTNREYLAYGLAQRDPDQGGEGFDYALVGEPRTFGLELTYRF